AMALAKAFNEDFKELADNGCEIIQLDEFVWPYGMGDWEIEALNASVEGVSCQFWVHTCWGNYSGNPAYFPDETETEFGAYNFSSRAKDSPAPERAFAIFPHVLDANIDALNYEVGRTGPDDLTPLRDNNWDKDFVAGVIDVKTTITESAAEVAERIREVLKVVPAERLGLSTDCGLPNLPRMVGAAKLRALVAGRDIVRGELGG
ncbi:MAG: methionine synthase, partial [Geodermatophilaceae bacterium]|nr:methionine synthase [Geodermatophilaceae bacterium]